MALPEPGAGELVWSCEVTTVSPNGVAAKKYWLRGEKVGGSSGKSFLGNVGDVGLAGPGDPGAGPDCDGD